MGCGTSASQCESSHPSHAYVSADTQPVQPTSTCQCFRSQPSTFRDSSSFCAFRWRHGQRTGLRGSPSEPSPSSTHCPIKSGSSSSSESSKSYISTRSTFTLSNSAGVAEHNLQSRLMHCGLGCCGEVWSWVRVGHELTPHVFCATVTGKLSLNSGLQSPSTTRDLPICLLFQNCNKITKLSAPLQRVKAATKEKRSQPYHTPPVHLAFRTNTAYGSEPSYMSACLSPSARTRWIMPSSGGQATDCLSCDDAHIYMLHHSKHAAALGKHVYARI
eukprot:SAG11_NODE_289_length_11184_cov_20.648083_9_plen_274_part_00